tara:strand:+ start:17849 stop:18847 length:999 start_codon:yes stop_codon:yes gene_type:complete
VSLSKGIKLGKLAKILGADLDGDPDKFIKGINTLSNANKDEISFLSRKEFIKDLKTTKASAVIISQENKDLVACDKIIVEDAYLVYAKATQVFKEIYLPPASSGISSLADISIKATISSTASIGSFSKVSDNAIINEGVQVGSGVFIGDSVIVGENTTINSNVSIYHEVELGKDCIIHSGTVLGSDGLGFARDGENWEKIDHLGRVIIGDRVEIGSNCSIDRGSIGDTILEEQVKLDNKVHVAHNVHIGRSTAIAANTAIAGSTVIGKNCTISGGCGVIDNINITDSVNITALSLVTQSITEPGTYTSGTPLMKHNLWKRNAVIMKKLKDMK